jgi:hypothetical protein
MMKFVLVGDIEFTDDTAYVRRVAYGMLVCEGEDMDELLDELLVLGKDYVMPHSYKGRIVFDRHRDEGTRQFLRDELIEKLKEEEQYEKSQAKWEE